MTGISEKTANFLGNIGVGNQIDVFLKQNNEVQTAWLRGEMVAMGERKFLDRENLLDTQRRYGITGAVASAQMQDLDLKYNQQVQKIRQQYAYNFMKSIQPLNLQQADTQDRIDKNAKSILLQKVAKKEATSVNSLRRLLQVGGASFANSITDDILQNLINNSEEVNNFIFKGQGLKTKKKEPKPTTKLKSKPTRPHRRSWGRGTLTWGRGTEIGYRASSRRYNKDIKEWDSSQK